MNKLVTLAFVICLTSSISCKKNEDDLVKQSLTYKESELNKKLYKMEKIRSETRELKSFTDEDRQL